MKNLYPGDYRTANSIDLPILPMGIAAGMGGAWATCNCSNLPLGMPRKMKSRTRWWHKTEESRSKNCFLRATLIPSESHLRLRAPEPLAYR